MKKSILIVDDDQSIRRNYIDILDDAGYRVVGLDSAGHLERAFNDNEFDLAILDISMSGDRMAGHKMCKSAKVLSPEVKVAMLTSLDDQRNRTLAFNSGADAYWIKNARSDGFLEDVKSLLNDQGD